ncbi:MAG: serine/threonine-protein kinase [bacterium]|nr:serine/threonine-protein kinase [bacterium]
MEIKGYKIEGQLGQGGMAMVYRAIQASLDRPVALKVMNPLFADNPQFTARFLEEGRLLASLRHNHIMTIYDIGVCDNLHYISMEYVDGGDLKQRIRNGISPLTALDYIITIGSCLHVAHASRIVHRDVKPVNILFRNDDTLLLADFGIAKQLVGRKSITITGSLVGSPYYLSPEQALGVKIDGRADIYSLGIVLFEMLMGKRPFDGDSQIDVALKHIEGNLPPLPPMLSHFQPLLDKMTAKQAHDRFRDAASMLQTARHLRDSHQWDSATRVSSTSHTYPGFDDTTVVYLADSQDDPHDNAISPDKTPTSNDQPKAGGENKTYAKTTARGLAKKGGIAAGLCVLALFTTLLTVGLPEFTITTPRLEINAEETFPATTENIKERTFEEPIKIKPHTVIEYALPSELILQNTQTQQVKRVNEAKAPKLARLEQIDRLLNAAQIALSEYRLTRPAGNNAYAYYHEVLRIEPSNHQANNGLTQIADRYLHLARKALSKGQQEKAEHYTRSGLKVKKAHPDLLSLKDELMNQQNQDHQVVNHQEQDYSMTDQHEPAEPESEVDRSKGTFFQRLKNMMKNQNNQVEEDPGHQQELSDDTA